MKKLISIIVIALVFVAQTNAQDKMNKAQEVKTVALEQTKGEFTQKALTLSEGTYVFEVSNNNAAPKVGLVLIEAEKDGSDANNHIKEAYVSQMVKHGKTESSKSVTLTKGSYKYFCPFNNTPQYTLIVE